MKDRLLLIAIFVCSSFVYSEQAIEYSYSRESAALLLYNLSLSKMEEKAICEQELNLRDLATLNEKEFLHLIEALYTHYIIRDLHDEQLYNLILKIINIEKNRIISHDEFVNLLQRILYISDNKYNSEQIIMEIIEKLHSKNKTISPSYSKSLLASAILNDNPSIINKLIEEKLIVPDDSNVLDLLFLSHAFVYKETNMPKQNPIYGDKQLFGNLPPKYYALERKNGVEIARILKSAGFVFKSPDKYIHILRNIDQFPTYSKIKLQNNALLLFEYVSDCERYDFEVDSKK